MFSFFHVGSTGITHNAPDRTQPRRDIRDSEGGLSHDGRNALDTQQRYVYRSEAATVATALGNDFLEG